MRTVSWTFVGWTSSHSASFIHFHREFGSRPSAARPEWGAMWYALPMDSWKIISSVARKALHMPATVSGVRFFVFPWNTLLHVLSRTPVSRERSAGVMPRS